MTSRAKNIAATTAILLMLNLLGVLALSAADAGWSSWATTSKSWQKQTGKLSKEIAELEANAKLVRDDCQIDEEEFGELNGDVKDARAGLKKARKAWRKWMRGTGVEDTVDHHIDNVEDLVRLMSQQLAGYVVLEEGDLPCKPPEKSSSTGKAKSVAPPEPPA